MARLYSVAIPALIFTFACDWLGRSINPAAYAGWWYNGSDQAEQVWRALTFSSQAMGDNLRIGTNGPFWSVAYEAWYYAAFGIAVFTRGWRRIALLAILAALAGLPILLLAPCWLAGVGLNHALKRQSAPVVAPGTAWIFALAPWAVYAGWLAIDMPGTLTLVTFAVFGAGEISPFAMFGFSNEFMWNSLLAVLFCAHFFGVHSLARNADWVSASAERAIRWLAGATFSIYLFHYPLLTLLHALPHYDAANPLHYAGAAGASLAACFALAELSERRLGAWKRLLDRAFARPMSPRGPARIADQPTKASTINRITSP
jgi:peptidoglycan/LPS O-acetylase OafA/YrhL